MALKLSSREYLLKPISNTDLEIALLRLVEIVKEKQQKTKAQENTEQKEKKLWEDLLIQCMQEEYWIEQTKRNMTIRKKILPDPAACSGDSFERIL